MDEWCVAPEEAGSHLSCYEIMVAVIVAVEQIAGHGYIPFKRHVDLVYRKKRLRHITVGSIAEEAELRVAAHRVEALVDAGLMPTLKYDESVRAMTDAPRWQCIHCDAQMQAASEARTKGNDYMNAIEDPPLAHVLATT